MRIVRFCPPRYFLATPLLLIVLGAVNATECGAPGSVSPPQLPKPEQLETIGARIGAIDIRVENIFDPTIPDESALPYRLANDLHVRTKVDTIRSQLLFAESEPYSRQRVAETERLLRGRRYLFDAWIEPICYYPASQTVDVQVRVRDVWSLNPGFTFNRKGGTNQFGFEFQDQDFLGRGETVSASWNQNIDRTSLLFVYDDPQLLGSWWRGRLAYSNNSDGSFGDLAVGRPFYSLDTRWTAGTKLAVGNRTDFRYQRGKVLDEFGEQVSRFEFHGGSSRGLRDGWARRWLAGVRYDSSEFSVLPDIGLVASLPEDRQLVYPWVGLEWVEDDFSTARNRDQLVRTEDLQFGRILHAELGLATPIWGADRTAVMMEVDGKTGHRLGESSSLFLTGAFTGRLESDGLRDAIVHCDARYYLRQRSDALLFASVRGSRAVNLDLDHQLLLGGDNGLRGYPLRYQSGTGSVLFTVEERLYTDWFPFRLFHIGAAAFADAGRVWGNDVAGEAPLGWLSNVGVGLRIGNARSGLGNVLHVDLAVPLARQPGIDSLQLLVQTRRSF